MDLQTRKLSFIQEIRRIQNGEIISGLEKMLKNSRAELFEKNLHPSSLEDFHADIDQALDDSANDRIISSSELLEESKKRK